MTTQVGTIDAVIVGGGIAGLVTAWELARAGRRPLLLESSDVVGGAVARHTVAGLVLDAGAESYATATPAVTTLIRELGLGPKMVQPNPIGAWVRHAGGTAPLPAAALLGIPAHPLAADVRRILGPVGAARAGLDLLLPGGFGTGKPGSLGALVGRRMGRAVVDRLVEPVAGGVYSTDPDNLDVDAVQPRLRAAAQQAGSLAEAVRLLRGNDARPGSAVAGLAGGMWVLAETLRRAVEELGGTIRTDSGVRTVRPDSQGWVVTTRTTTFRAPNVVLGVPGQVVQQLLAGIDVSLPSATAQSSDVMLVTLVLDHSGLDSHPRGTGILVSRRAGSVTAKALTHATAKWSWLAGEAGAGRHVLRLSYGRGGSGHPSSDGLVELSVRDAATLTGVGLRLEHLVDSAVVSWTSTLPRPAPGHRATITALRAQVAAQAGLYLVGSMVAGTGLAAVIADARSTSASILGADPSNG